MIEIEKHAFLLIKMVAEREAKEYCTQQALERPKSRVTRKPEMLIKSKTRKLKRKILHDHRSSTMSQSYLTPQQWLRVSGGITGGETFAARYERFPAFFGVKLAVVMAVWRFFNRNGMLLNKDNKGFSPKHLLWTLLFLFKYDGEKFLSALCGTTRKTYRKWIWIGCNMLFDLDPVSESLICKASHR